MFWLVVTILVLVGGAATARTLMTGQRRRRELAGDEPLALPAGDHAERTLAQLRVGDVVTVDGRDFLCEGVLAYDEDGHRWTGGRLVDGSDVKWCVVGIERVGASAVRLLSPEPFEFAAYPPELLVLGEVRYTLDKRGTASVSLTGDLGELAAGRVDRPPGSVERCRWWLYNAVGDDTAIVEQWGADYRVLRGKKVAEHMIEMIPGS